MWLYLRLLEPITTGSGNEDNKKIRLWKYMSSHQSVCGASYWASNFRYYLHCRIRWHYYKGGTHLILILSSLLGHIKNIRIDNLFCAGYLWIARHIYDLKKKCLSFLKWYIKLHYLIYHEKCYRIITNLTTARRLNLESALFLVQWLVVF